MSIYANKTPQNKAQAIANEPVQRQNKSNSVSKFVGNRPESIAQRKLKEAIESSPRIHQLKAYQEMADKSLQVKQMKLGINVNDDAGLEREADIMGETAQRYIDQSRASSQRISHSSSPKDVVQRIKIDASTVSEEVLAVFNGLSPFVKALFQNAKEVPGFVAMTDKKKIQFFHHMDKVMSEQKSQVQEEEAVTSSKTFSPVDDMGRFIKESILFNDGVEEKSTRLLLIESLKSRGVEIPEKTDFRQLEIMHATHMYKEGDESLGKRRSMKKFKPNHEKDITQIDQMRINQVAAEQTEIKKEAGPKKEIKKKAGPQKEPKKEAGPQYEISQLLAPLMPKLVELSNFIRLASYFDAASEESIRNSGRLQSKQRRQLKASKGDTISSKSSEIDDSLGNTDHVFFFAEFEENDEPAKFRTSRFGGQPEQGAVLTSRGKLDGTERRVSFPLNSMDHRGMHGYVKDIGREVNPYEDIFSSSSAVGTTTTSPAGSASSTESSPPTAKQVAPPSSGPHLLMDLLRQRFKPKNFPAAHRTDVAMIANLEGMTNLELYTFLFRIHPGFQKPAKPTEATSSSAPKKSKQVVAPVEPEQVNPQILVPGSVSFSTPGVRFDEAPKPAEPAELVEPEKPESSSSDG